MGRALYFCLYYLYGSFLAAFNTLCLSHLKKIIIKTNSWRPSQICILHSYHIDVFLLLPVIFSSYLLQLSFSSYLHLLPLFAHLSFTPPPNPVWFMPSYSDNLPKVNSAVLGFFLHLLPLLVYLWLRWVFIATCGLSLVVVSRATFPCDAGASYLGGFSCCRAWAQ